MSDRFDDAVCGVCARNATGIGYAPKAGYRQPHRPILWVCDDEECIQIARNTYAMKQNEFDRIEALAVLEGLDAGRECAIAAGTADLSEMSDGQRLDFARAIVNGYRSALKVKLRDEAPF